MYSEQLEAIIDASLADGMLTEKEREVLHKRAALEGVDADELDVVIDGRLAKMKKQEDWLRPTPPKNLENEKLGNVVKCPSCGAQIVSGLAVCPECGYAFTNIAANSSVERLQEKLDEFNRRQEIRSDNSSVLRSTFKRAYGYDETCKHKMDVISTFPVPNTRGDLLEFLTMLRHRAVSTGPRNGMTLLKEEDLGYAYWLLYTNCINKAKISFSNDPDFEPYYADYEEKLEKTKGIIGYLKCNPKSRFFIFIVLGYVVFFGLIGLIGLILE